MDKYKNLIIIGLFILFMGSLGVIYYLVQDKNEELLTIKGEVIGASDDYVIIEGINEDYVINNIKGKYKVGDLVEFKYIEKDIDKNASPKTIKVRDEELVKVKEIEENDTNKEEEDNNSLPNNNIDNNSSNNSSNTSSNNKDNESDNSSSTGNTSQTNKPNTSINDNTEDKNSGSNSNSYTNSGSEEDIQGADAQVLSYFNDYQTKIDSGNLGSSVKSGFVSIVDFLFYNGTIKGHTFKELTASAKLKVLAMALYFDGKIDKYFPGYKESISSTASKIYTNVKERIVSTYLNVASSVCASKSEACESAKKGFAELKKNFSLTWDLIKDIAGDGLTNLKNWYEIWRAS